MKRNFDVFISQLRDSIASWSFYVDFEKVYRNTDLIKDELNILNGLVGAKDIKNEFKRIVKKYPHTINVIPIFTTKSNLFSVLPTFEILDKSISHLLSISERYMDNKKDNIYDIFKENLINEMRLKREAIFLSFKKSKYVPLK